jgi:SAM-dependent methyltransferase
MIYQRPESIKTTIDNYLKDFSNIETAKNSLFNIGAGTWEHPCWTNLDLPAQTPAFAAIQAPCIPHDLVNQEELPIPSDSVYAFYCSHVIEHLPEFAVNRLMKEVYRCLKKGGVFRIVTGPCADLDWSALLRNDLNWWFWHEQNEFKSCSGKDSRTMTIFERWLYHLATPRSTYSDTPCERKFEGKEILELVKKNMSEPTKLWDILTESLVFDQSSPGNHISWWNYNKLSANLSNAGFCNIRRSAYGQSQFHILRDLTYFDQTYPQISVYVETIK